MSDVFTHHKCLTVNYHIVLNTEQGEGKGDNFILQKSLIFQNPSQINFPMSFKGVRGKGAYLRIEFNVNINQRKITFPAPLVNATTDDRIQSFVVMSFCVAVGSSCSIVAF